jgi:hypothetical protein
MLTALYRQHLSRRTEVASSPFFLSFWLRSYRIGGTGEVIAMLTKRGHARISKKSYILMFASG